MGSASVDGANVNGSVRIPRSQPRVGSRKLETAKKLKQLHEPVPANTLTQSVRKRAVSFFLSSVGAGAMLGGAWRSEALGWFGVAGIALFFWGQLRCVGLRGTVIHAYLTGVVSFSIACSWLPSTVRYLSECGLLASYAWALACYSTQSLGLILFGTFWRAMQLNGRRVWFVVPILWVALEHVLPTLFPWPPAVLLTADLPLLQVAELGGVDLASMLVLSSAVFLAWSMELACQFFGGFRLQQKVVWQWSLVFLLLFGIRIAGVQRIQQIDVAIEGRADGNLRVGLIQADTRFADSNPRMVEATRAMQGLIDLAVWPESALGDYSRELRDFNDPGRVKELSTGEDTGFVPFPDPHCLLLAGADRWDDIEVDGKPDRHFVSALLINELENLVGCRDKVELMPYGEYIPGESVLPFLRDWWGDERVISSGVEPVPIGRIGDFQVGALLCCEDMHPGLVRGLVRRGANLLVTLGNGMAFDSEIALRQHFRIARLRAIEHRVYFLRCTSSGVSGLVAPSGKVLHEMPAMQDVAVVLSIPQLPPTLGQTFFTRNGWLLPYVLGISSILAWLVKKRGGGGSSSALRFF